jgi:hypothetical protein
MKHPAILRRRRGLSDAEVAERLRPHGNVGLTFRRGDFWPPSEIEEALVAGHTPGVGVWQGIPIHTGPCPICGFEPSEGEIHIPSSQGSVSRCETFGLPREDER